MEVLFTLSLAIDSGRSAVSSHSSIRPSTHIKVYGVIWTWGTTYLRKSDVGDDHGVQRAGRVAERLALVTAGMVLVLVVLTIVITLPRHGAVGDAHVALGGDGGGLGAEVPIRRIAVS